MNWSKDARFKISGEALTRSFQEDKLALVHMKTKRTHVLNSTAAAIWKMIGSGSSVGEIRSQLAKDYTVEESQITHEVQELLTLLKEEEFIEPL